MHLAAMVTAAVDTVVTKQLQAVESRCMKISKGTKSTQGVATRRCQEAQLSNMLREPDPEPVVQNGVDGASRVICECRSAPALLQSMDVYAGDPQLL